MRSPEEILADLRKQEPKTRAAIKRRTELVIEAYCARVSIYQIAKTRGVGQRAIRDVVDRWLKTPEGLAFAEGDGGTLARMSR